MKTVQLLPCAQYDRFSNPEPSGCDWTEHPAAADRRRRTAALMAPAPASGTDPSALMVGLTLVAALSLRLVARAPRPPGSVMSLLVADRTDAVADRSPARRPRTRAWVWALTLALAYLALPWARDARPRCRGGGAGRRRSVGAGVRPCRDLFLHYRHGRAGRR